MKFLSVVYKIQFCILFFSKPWKRGLQTKTMPNKRLILLRFGDTIKLLQTCILMFLKQQREV